MKRITRTFLLLLTAIAAVMALGIAASAAEAEAANINDANYYGGHTYLAVKEMLSWPDAEAYCKKLGGHLVTVTSEKENSYVYQMSTKMDTDLVWLGGTDVEEEGTWKWVTGEKFNYTNWHSGEPNNGSGNQDYIQIYTKDATWDDAYNYDTNYFICEWDYQLTLSAYSMQLKAGESDYLFYTVKNASGEITAPATFKSSNLAVAKVSSKGKVVAVAPGVCKITVKSKGLSRTCTVIVTPKKVTGVSKAAASRTSIKLRWTKQGTSSTKYQVYMYDPDLEEYTLLKNTASNTYTAKYLKRGTTYRFKIRAYLVSNGKKYYGPYSKVLYARTAS